MCPTPGPSYLVFQSKNNIHFKYTFCTALLRTQQGLIASVLWTLETHHEWSYSYYRASINSVKTNRLRTYLQNNHLLSLSYVSTA